MQKKQIPEKDWQTAWEIHRTLTREWFKDLSQTDRLALIFVFDRTLGWGKVWERITYEQGAKGVVDSEGICWAQPFASHRDRAAAALQSLVDKGYLLSRNSKNPSDRAREYCLNHPMILPKRLQGNVVKERPGSGALVRPGSGASKSASQEDKRLRRNIRSASADTDASVEAPQPALPDQSPLAEIERRTVDVLARSADRRKSKLGLGSMLRKNKTGWVPLRSGMEQQWVSLMEEHFPGEPKMTMPAVVSKILWMYARKWTEARDSGEFMEFLSWVFRNWLRIRAGVLSWMTACPPFPSPEILVSAKLRRVFETAYAEKEKWDKWAKLSEYEREVETLLGKGFDREVAEGMAQERYGLDREKKELRALRDTVALMQKSLEKQRIALASQIKPKDIRPLKAEGDFTWREE